MCIRDRLDSVPDEIALVDVRNPAEAEVASIEGSHLVPLASLESGEAIDRVRALAEGRRLLVHCKLGGALPGPLSCWLSRASWPRM